MRVQLPTMISVADAVEDSELAEDDLFENGANGSLDFVVIVPELGACHVSREAMSHFLAGAESYPANGMAEYFSKTLSGPWSIRRDRLRIVQRSWIVWAEHHGEIARLMDEAEVEKARRKILNASKQSLVMYARLQASSTEFRGGRITDTDLVSLVEAAEMATRHAGTSVKVADVLRAASRGEILLRAIVHQRARVFAEGGGVCINAGHETDENTIPDGSIPTLPLTACAQLANAGHASWRSLETVKSDGQGGW